MREPLLAFGEPGNVHTWLRGRQMLLLFGERYRARISVYIGLYLLLLLLIILSICVSLLQLEPHMFNLQVSPTSRCMPRWLDEQWACQ